MISHFAITVIVAATMPATSSTTPPSRTASRIQGPPRSSSAYTAPQTATGSSSAISSGTRRAVSTRPRWTSRCFGGS